MQCSLPDGCVSIDKVKNFLHNKYIPGSDNVLTPYLPEPGHMFGANLPADHVLKDMRWYMLTRPVDAVPENVRKLLFPGGKEQWPGGQGGDRSQFYPKTLGANVNNYWETDIDPVKEIQGAQYQGQGSPMGAVGGTMSGVNIAGVGGQMTNAAQGMIGRKLLRA